MAASQVSPLRLTCGQPGDDIRVDSVSNEVETNQAVQRRYAAVAGPASHSCVDRSGQSAPPLRDGSDTAEVAMREVSAMLRPALSVRHRQPRARGCGRVKRALSQRVKRALRRCAPWLLTRCQGTSKAVDSQTPPFQRKWMPLLTTPSAVDCVNGAVNRRAESSISADTPADMTSILRWSSEYEGGRERA